MKRVMLLGAILIPGMACAQSMSSNQPTMNMPNYSTSRIEVADGFGADSQDTPSMRRARLVRALALREEAARLLREDGGTFTAQHQAYVRRKARAILSNNW